MLTWNEIRTRAAQFAERWQDAVKENAEAQTFWNEFLAVYGIDRRRVAAFERKVKACRRVPDVAALTCSGLASSWLSTSPRAATSTKPPSRPSSMWKSSKNTSVHSG
ncbi:type IIL restriction-modification enzyme MmeI [Deinococcus radiophilus]|uniref:type IIL restriction-modification enzyme MmeI n=1 Tax=Deinococcus radiophilus TaxID=32062 RepID=UPI003623A3F0